MTQLIDNTDRRGFLRGLGGILGISLLPDPLAGGSVPAVPVRDLDGASPADGGKKAVCECRDGGFCDPKWLDAVLNLDTGEITYVGHDFFLQHKGDLT